MTPSLALGNGALNFLGPTSRRGTILVPEFNEAEGKFSKILLYLGSKQWLAVLQNYGLEILIHTAKYEGMIFVLYEVGVYIFKMLQIVGKPPQR